MLGKYLTNILFNGLDLKHLYDPHQRQAHKVPQHLHKIHYKTKKESWFHIPNPFKTIKEFTSWGEIKFIDEQGNELETHIESYESHQTFPLLKQWEEKEHKYLAYEAAAKMFYPEDDYKNRGKCPIMSFFTSEEMIDAKMNEP
jgi:hypothetical protein